MPSPVVLTVCVGYWDFLRVTLPSTVNLAKHVYIMTTPDFVYGPDTLEPHEHVTVWMVDMFAGGKSSFNKAGAIRAGQEILHEKYPDDWILLLDADIVVPETIFSTLHEPLDRAFLYGAKRLDFLTPDTLVGIPYPIDNAGYFQLYFDKTKMYPAFSKNASECDMTFLALFPQTVTIQTPVKHLGYCSKNWNGRVTEPWLL